MLNESEPCEFVDMSALHFRGIEDHFGVHVTIAASRKSAELFLRKQ